MTALEEPATGSKESESVLDFLAEAGFSNELLEQLRPVIKHQPAIGRLGNFPALLSTLRETQQPFEMRLADSLYSVAKEGAERYPARAQDRILGLLTGTLRPCSAEIFREVLLCVRPDVARLARMLGQSDAHQLDGILLMLHYR